MKDPILYSNKPIFSLQTMLRQISTVDTRVLPVIPNGRYDSSTYASVRSFQESYGLKPTGTTDITTWNTIISVYDEAVSSYTVPSLLPGWSLDQTISKGQTNYHVYLVQAMLIALAEFFPQLVKPEPSGTLDIKTQDGLRWVQVASSLEPTGILNTATWNYLSNLYRTIIGDGSPITRTDSAVSLFDYLPDVPQHVPATASAAHQSQGRITPENPSR